MLDLSGTATLETAENKQDLASFIGKCLDIRDREKSIAVVATPVKPT